MTLYRYALAYALLLAAPLALLRRAMRRRRKPGTIHAVVRADTRQLRASMERARLLAAYYAGRPPRITVPDHLLLNPNDWSRL